MITGRRVLMVLPARGGSKGIPLKNLQEVGGLSLIAWVGRVIKQLPEIDRSVISTDYERMAQLPRLLALPRLFAVLTPSPAIVSATLTF